MITRMKVERQTDVPARMRDGTILRADVYRPAEAGTYPVLLTRTPYGKSMMPLSIQSNEVLAANGYIVVAQDVRGRFASDGEYRFNHDDVADGYDSVAWAATLDGSNGAVGMFGASYMGFTQLFAAVKQPPQLRAIFPVWTSANIYEGRTYDGGALRLVDRLGWSMGQALDTANRLGIDAPEVRRISALSRERMEAFMAGDQARVNRVRADLEAALDPLLRHLPLSSLPALEGLAPHYFDALEHPSYDEYWRALHIERSFPRWDLPAFSVGGWYDLFLKGNLDLYTDLKARSRTPESRRAQRLLVGPGTHGNFTPQVGDLDFGPEAALDLLPLQVRWFDHWLKGVDTGLLDEPPVRVFVMGANRWRNEQDWPLPNTHYVSYYLHSGGSANTLDGDGLLSPEPPGDEVQDTFVYDPNDPVPTIGGRLLGSAGAAGPFDQRRVEARRDVLCYTTPPLSRDIEVTGPLSVTVYAASSAPDTDWTAKLVDVHPNGAAYNLQEGIIRASHRIEGAAPSQIRPGDVYEYTIDLWATSNVFLAGHCFRLEISSSNFPHWDRNLNTGDLSATSSRTAIAHQRIFHDAAHPSHILLPIISE